MLFRSVQLPYRQNRLLVMALQEVPVRARSLVCVSTRDGKSTHIFTQVEVQIIMFKNTLVKVEVQFFTQVRVKNHRL